MDRPRKTATCSSGLCHHSGATPLRRGNFRPRIWVPALAEVGLSGTHFHDLRRSGNVMTAAAGTPLRELMDRMGHSNARAAGTRTAVGVVPRAVEPTHMRVDLGGGVVGLPGLEPGTSSLSEWRHSGPGTVLAAVNWAYAAGCFSCYVVVSCVYPHGPQRPRAAVGPSLGLRNMPRDRPHSHGHGPAAGPGRLRPEASGPAAFRSGVPGGTMAHN